MSEQNADVVSDATGEEVLEVVETTQGPSRQEKLLALEESFHNRGKTEETVVPEETTEEPVVEEVKPVKEELSKEDEFTGRFAQLAKMEAKLREREDRINAADKDREELEKLRELKVLAKTDPMAVANQLGLSVNDLAEQAINGETFNEKRKVDEVTERLKKLEDMQKEAVQSKTQRDQEDAARKYVDTLESNVRSKAEDYPLVLGLNGGMNLMVNTISAYYQKSGEELPWEKAAQMTEEYLMDQKIKEYEHLIKIDKIKKRIGAGVMSDKPTPDSTTTKVVEKAKTVKTISNQAASAPATREVGKTTKEERERRIRELTDGLFK